MAKVNLINYEGWEFITVVSISNTPNVGDYLYNITNGHYYSIEMIIHDRVKRKIFKFLPDKLVTTLIIKKTNFKKPT
jgi:hypothetical protein